MLLCADASDRAYAPRPCIAMLHAQVLLLLLLLTVSATASLVLSHRLLAHSLLAQLIRCCILHQQSCSLVLLHTTMSSRVEHQYDQEQQDQDQDCDDAEVPARPAEHQQQRGARAVTRMSEVMHPTRGTRIQRAHLRERIADVFRSCYLLPPDRLISSFVLRVTRFMPWIASSNSPSTSPSMVF